MKPFVGVTIKSIKMNIEIQKRNTPDSKEWQKASKQLDYLYGQMERYANQGLLPEGKTIEDIIGV